MDRITLILELGILSVMAVCAWWIINGSHIVETLTLPAVLRP